MFYGVLSTIAFIIILPFWLFIGLFNKKLLAGFLEKLGVYNSNKIKTLLTKSKKIVFYGVSVGEVIAMENLIKKAHEIFPGYNIILLTGTQTGQEIAKKKLGSSADFITYFPLDFPFCINNMLNVIKPDAIFIMETELWPNFANITNEKKIPTYIINARISDSTYNTYKKLNFFFSPILQKYRAIYPQSKQDYEKFISLGANPETTKIMGNLKFDIKKPDVSNLNFEKNPQHKIILAGSIHNGEDEIILNAFNMLKKEINNLKLIIAPRHLNSQYKPDKYACRSQKATFEKNDIIFLDTMGELSKFYSVCDVAFIGGSFKGNIGDNRPGKGVGGHNPLEATIFDKPVVSGPSIHNFKDIYAILTSTNAGKIVETPGELRIYIKKLLTNEEFYQKASKDCKTVFEQNKGAIDFVIDVLQKLV